LGWARPALDLPLRLAPDGDAALAFVAIAEA
jgi:hypothetical protein